MNDLERIGRARRAIGEWIRRIELGELYEGWTHEVLAVLGQPVSRKLLGGRDGFDCSLMVYSATMKQHIPLTGDEMVRIARALARKNIIPDPFDPAWASKPRQDAPKPDL